MAPTAATIKLNDSTVLPLRIFVNRKRLLHNNTKEKEFHTPLLSNNSIVCIKSPSTRIYLSNHDMHNLCTEIKTEILLIVFELSAPRIKDHVMKNVRIGQTLDFQKVVMAELFTGDCEGLLTSHIQTITKVAKSKIKLHYKKNWELDIFINSTKRLTDIRSAVLLKECGSDFPNLGIYSKRRMLLTEITSPTQHDILQEDIALPMGTDAAPLLVADEKPKLTFRYKPVVSFGDCIDIHVLQRPKRKKDASAAVK